MSMLLHQRLAEGERRLACWRARGREARITENITKCRDFSQSGCYICFLVRGLYEDCAKQITTSINASCPHVQFKLWLQDWLALIFFWSLILSFFLTRNKDFTSLARVYPDEKQNQRTWAAQPPAVSTAGLADAEEFTHTQAAVPGFNLPSRTELKK